MKLGGAHWTTLVDDPGHVAATLFAVGCNFRCPYCHNPELVLPEDASCSERLSTEKAMQELERRRGFLDSVVVSGGEPTLQPDLAAFLRRIKGLGYRIKLDTNGSRPDVLRDVLSSGLADYVAMDVKAPWPAYAAMARAPIRRKDLIRSVALIRRQAQAYEFRTTAGPGLTLDALIQTGEQLGTAEAYWIQAFRDPGGTSLLDPACRAHPVLSRDDLEEAWNRLSDRFERGGVRG